jgi:hypothetical protein
MFNDAIDDQPQTAGEGGFIGFDCHTNPKLLPAGMLADGKNMYCRGDGSVQTRPGTRINAAVVRATLAYYGTATSADITILASCYYDTPTYEATIVFTSNGGWAITGHGDDLLATRILTTTPYITARTDSQLVQMVDRLYYLDTFSQLHWLKYDSGTWTTDPVVRFSDNITMMPTWSYIATQNFRLLAMEATGYKIYASAVGSAATYAEWVQNENIQVGTGEGDAGQVLLATQGGAITLLNARSAYQINTGAATVAAWSSIQISRGVGCIAPRTAAVLGQETFFLSRHGLVKLSDLSDTISIAAQDTLSYPIQPYIDRINVSAISAAFATTWRDLYLLALPLDSETLPTRIFAYDLNRQRWMPPWVYTGDPPTWVGQSTPYTWTGLTGAVATNFADKPETMLIDNVGQLRRIDTAYDTDQSFLTFGVVAPFAMLTQTASVIPSYLRTRDFTHDTTAAKKHPFYIEVELSSNNANPTYIDLLLLGDGAATRTTAPNSATVGYITKWLVWNEKTIKRQQTRGQFYDRTIAPYYSAAIELFSAQRQMTVRRIELSAFIDAPFYAP